VLDPTPEGALGTPRGSLCCIGTSATLGSPDARAHSVEYAEQIFGEPFDAESVITEARQLPEELFQGRLIEHFHVPRCRAARSHAGMRPRRTT
jgi:DEAD/DEAH box helicase domain-containing protein